ncbi:MAG: TaqI-like C-terminal specificity domain-containing protein [Actinomycetota bacterium]
MAAPQAIIELIERYEQNREQYRAGVYSEAEIRTEFIDPLFEALGWDIANKKARAEQYKDVVREASVDVEGKAKKPDYEFRIGGTRKFYVEAKKPSINLKEDMGVAFQIRRYAWSAKLPLGIITDFEEFAVYDCRTKPNVTDKAGVGRLNYYTYKDYADKWDEIAGIFSQDAILKGAFDKYAISDKKRGTQTVDEAFLKEIESWREELAKNIAIRNKHLTVEQLNYSVQQTIDRIIFLRICEDRGVESYGDLQKIASGKEVYKALLKHFLYADERYNSGLFHFKKEKDIAEDPDDLTPSLTIDDKTIKEIIKRIYYPNCPYEFSVISADILGQVYERFLGKVIRLTEGHQAKVEDKPEVKKAGGVYYTPTYIVDYIVKNTVGKLVEGKTPKDVDKLNILDPACGSGSFLIGAYQFLLDWYLEYYRNHEPAKLLKGKSPKLYESSSGYRLTLPERRRILINNIHGVDIDSQAVEVTKLSLLLKVLEDETQRTLFDKRVLPDLSANIKCGNSLIGTDYFAEKLIIEPEELARINPMDWEQAFPEVFGTPKYSSSDPDGSARRGNREAGGFDAVIGNPPYVRQEILGDAFKAYAKAHFKTYAGTADLYTYFIEKGVGLLKKGGHFGIIVANKWMRANYGEPLRKWLKEQHIEGIIDFGDLPVFQTATTYPCILTIGKDGTTRTFQAAKIDSLDFDDLALYVKEREYTVNQTSLDDKGWPLANEVVQALLDKLKSKGVPLGEYVGGKIYRGFLTGFNDAFVVDKATRDRLIDEDPKSHDLVMPWLRGRDIKRWKVDYPDLFVLYIPWDLDIGTYPAVEAHLKSFRKELEDRPEAKAGRFPWFALSRYASEYFEDFKEPKIVYPNICRKPEFAFDNKGVLANQKCYIIPLEDKYLLGVLNSKLNNFLFQHMLPKLRGGFYEPSSVFFVQFPIKVPDDSIQSEKNMKADIIRLSDNMLRLMNKIPQAKTPTERESLQRQIDATDRQINQLVYELYDLTPEEIKIVEGSII